MPKYTAAAMMIAPPAMVEMNVRQGSSGNKAVGRIAPTSSSAYYLAMTQIAGTSDEGTTVNGTATFPRTYTTTVTETGGSITTTVKDQSTAASTHTKAGTFSGNGKVRIFVPTGGVLTVSSVKLEEV